MLTDTNLRSAVDALWDKLWSGGLSNPLDAVEQLTQAASNKNRASGKAKGRTARHSSTLDFLARGK